MAAGEHLGEQFFHLTDDPKFAPDPGRTPTDNSITLSRLLSEPRKGLYVTKTPEHWVNRYNYVRPYVAELHVPSEHVEHGEYGGEGFIPSERLHHARVSRVIPLDAHVREQFGEHGWVEEHHGTTFDTGAKIKEQGWNEPRDTSLKGYRYSGPDVRQMTRRQTERHRKRTNRYLVENRGFSKEDFD
jgi:hypothetical protein